MKGRWARFWVTRRFVAIMLAIPPWLTGLAVVAMLQSYLQLEHLWIMSIVLVGSLVSTSLNMLLLDFNIKVIQRFKDEPEYVLNA